MDLANNHLLRESKCGIARLTALSMARCGRFLGLTALRVVVAVSILSVSMFASCRKGADPAGGKKESAGAVVNERSPSAVSSARVPRTYPEDGDVDGVYELSGEVDRYPIVMRLEIDGTEVTGSYYYRKNGPKARLELHGTNYNNGELDINEYNKYGEMTAYFYGHIKKDVFRGTFTTSKGKEMSFYLKATRFHRWTENG